MSVMDWLAARFGFERKARARGIDAPPFLLQGLDLGEYHPEVPDYALAKNQAELYQRIIHVHTAVSTVSGSVASTPLQVMQRTGEKKEAIENHPFEVLLDNVNPLQSRFEFLEATSGYRDLTGNCYWWLNRSRPEAAPDEIWILPSHQVRPVPDARLYLRGYLYDPMDGTTPLPLEPWEVVHFKRFHPLNRFVGLSVIEALAVDVHGELAMQQWNTNFFSKEHAKPAGALAFAAPIADPDWDRMKADIKRDHGGTERRMMLLRNAGKEGVQWIQMGYTQKDMEFLNARQFTKEEIYSAFAPGLASVLAINATEANSVAGKATLMEFGVYPRHQAIAQTLTRHILPAYGEGLVAEFEDVRLSDTAMELQEMALAFKLLKRSEARERYFQLPPLGDERDDEIVEGPPPPGQTPPQLLPFTGQPPDPTRPTDPPAPEAEIEGERTGEDEPDALMKADLGRWERKAIKRFKAKEDAACRFESDAIPERLHGMIEHGLEHVYTVDDIRNVFAGAVKARSTAARNAPDDLERRRRERRLFNAFMEYFVGQRERVLAEVAPPEGAR